MGQLTAEISRVLPPIAGEIALKGDARARPAVA